MAKTSDLLRCSKLEVNCNLRDKRTLLPGDLYRNNLLQVIVKSAAYRKIREFPPESKAIFLFAVHVYVQYMQNYIYICM